MFIILIVVCTVNLVLLVATGALLNYIAKQRGRPGHHSCSGECKDIEAGKAHDNALAPAGYSCVTLGSQGVYVMPSSQMDYPISKGTPFGTSKKITTGASSLDASTLLSSTVSSFNNSLDSFGVTLGGVLSLNAQLEELQRQTGEQKTSTRISTDLGAALDKILAKHGQRSSSNIESVLETDQDIVLNESFVKLSHGTAKHGHGSSSINKNCLKNLRLDESQGNTGSMESGHCSGLNSQDLGKALDKVLSKHNYRQIVKAQREKARKEIEIIINPSTLTKTW